MKEIDWNRFAASVSREPDGYAEYTGSSDEQETGRELVTRFLHKMVDVVELLDPVECSRPEGRCLGGIVVSNVDMNAEHSPLADGLPAFDAVVRLYDNAGAYKMYLQFLNPYSCGELQTYAFEPAEHIISDFNELYKMFSEYYKVLDEEAGNFDMLLEQAKCIVDAAGRKNLSIAMFDEFVFQLLCMRVMLNEII